MQVAYPAHADCHFKSRYGDIDRLLGEPSFPADDVTEELIEALAKHPNAVNGRAVSDLLPHRGTLVSYKRESVLRVYQAIVNARGSELGNIATELFNAGGPLVSIAMTLQRFPETRHGGLNSSTR